MQRILAAAICTFVAGSALADDMPLILDPINVEGNPPVPRLDQPSETGSHVGLTPRETPATVDIVSREDIREKGLRDLIEIYNSAPGVRAGNLPGEPGVTTMRGFSRGATGYTVDGTRALDPLLTSRNFDSYTMERVEILKGPASVVHGTGALAGNVNIVTKQPVSGESFAEGLASYGSHDTARAGAGFNKALGDRAALRSTVSYSRSDGHVEDTDWRKVGMVTGFAAQPSDRLSVGISLDYFHDDFRTPYQGAPWFPAAWRATRAGSCRPRQTSSSTRRPGTSTTT